jgi:hypothetical protein
VVQDADDDVRGGDEGDDVARATTVVAGLHVDSEGAAQKVGPVRERLRSGRGGGSMALGVVAGGAASMVDAGVGGPGPGGAGVWGSRPWVTMPARAEQRFDAGRSDGPGVARQDRVGASSSRSERCGKGPQRAWARWCATKARHLVSDSHVQTVVRRHSLSDSHPPTVVRGHSLSDSLAPTVVRGTR